MISEMELEKLKLENSALRKELSAISANAFVMRMVLRQIKSWNFPTEYKKDFEMLISHIGDI